MFLFGDRSRLAPILAIGCGKSSYPLFPGRHRRASVAAPAHQTEEGGRKKKKVKIKIKRGEGLRNPKNTLEWPNGPLWAKICKSNAPWNIFFYCFPYRKLFMNNMKLNTTSLPTYAFKFVCYIIYSNHLNSWYYLFHSLKWLQVI